MAAKTTKKDGESTVAFTKEQLIASNKYRDSRDLVTALLEDGKTYTVKEVDIKIQKYMKGEVK